METELKTLWRVAGLGGMVSAITLLLFLVMLSLVWPARGFDFTRLFDPDHTLAFFAAQPATIRLVGQANMTTMTASILLILGLSLHLYPQQGGAVIVGGALGMLGWLMLLMGEHADLTVFVHLSKLYSTEPDLAKSGFTLAVRLASQTRGWGYLLLAFGMAALAAPLGRAAGWPGALRWISLRITAGAFVLFLFEDVLVLDPDFADPGSILYALGSASFGLSFGLVFLLLPIWNGWVGWRLWKGGLRMGDLAADELVEDDRGN